VTVASAAAYVAALTVTPTNDGARRYHTDTSQKMAMTLRLTADEQGALRARAECEGISMQEAARRAVREYVERGEHRDRVAVGATRVISAHGDALDRLGE